jgi:hypothetical protein
MSKSLAGGGARPARSGGGMQLDATSVPHKSRSILARCQIEYGVAISFVLWRRTLANMSHDERACRSMAVNVFFT